MADGPRRRRWWLIGGAVAACVVVILAAVPFLVPMGRYRTLLQDYIRTATGRDVEIAKLSLALWPRAHVHAVGVRLMNPRGFPPGPTLEAKSVDLGVDLHALLGRRLAITYVALGGVRVNFLTNDAGRSNFDLPARPAEAPAAPAGATAAGGGPLLSLDPIGVVTVKNAALSFGTYDARRGRTTASFALAGLGATARSVDPGAPDWTRRLAVSVNLKGARIEVPSLRVPVQVRSGVLTLAGGGAKATFALALDTLQVTGTAAVPRLGAPRASFAIAAPELNVGRLRRLLDAAALGAAGPAGPARLLATGTVAVGRVIAAPLAVRDVRARLEVYTNGVRVPVYSLAAYGGTASGTAALDAAAAGAPVTVTVRARRISLAQVIQAVAPGARTLTGALDADMQLRTMSARDPEAALTGAGTFAIRNGSFPGLDLRSGLVRMARLLQLNLPAGPTRFSYFGGDARIANERVYSNALRLDGEGMQAVAHGSFGFDETLSYAGTGVMPLNARTPSPSGGLLPPASQLFGRYIPGAAGATAVRVPFSIGGTAAAPHFALAGAPQFVGAATPSPRQPSPGQPGLPQLPSLLQNLLKGK